MCLNSIQRVDLGFFGQISVMQEGLDASFGDIFPTLQTNHSKEHCLNTQGIREFAKEISKGIWVKMRITVLDLG